MSTHKEDSIEEVKKDCEYESFHQYVMWGQKQNKKNPWKFWTIEIYDYIMKHLLVLSFMLEDKEFKEFVKWLDKSIKY